MERLKSCFCFGSSDPQGVISGPSPKHKVKLENKHIINIFEDVLKTRKNVGSKTAIHFSEANILTFNQLNAFASCLSKSITERLGYDYKLDNPDNDMVIAVCLPMSEKAIALILGILKTGCAYLPLDPNFPENLLLEILTTCKPVMMISDDNGKIFNKYDCDQFTKICNKLVSIEELWLDVEFTKEPRTKRNSMEKAWEIDFLEHKDHDPALRPVAIFYSHGLVKEPVGVRVSSKSILNLTMHLTEKYGITKNDQCCFTVSIASPYSLPQLFIPLLHGCTLHVFRRLDVYDADKFVKNLSWRNITSLSIPTHNLPDILQAVENVVDQTPGHTHTKPLKLELVMCRGSFIPPEWAQTFFQTFKSGVVLASCVGSVETTCDIAIELYSSLKDYESKLVDGNPCYGTIIENTKVYVVDENMKLVSDGETGQICVSGSCLANGYVNETQMGENNNFVQKNPFSSSPPFERLYKTGEYGKIIKLGLEKKRYLMVEGRRDSRVKVRGHLFHKTEVEYFLKEMEGVIDAYCFVYDAGKADQFQEFIGYLIMEDRVAIDETLAADYDFALKNKLPEWAIPDELIFIKRIPECKCIIPKKDEPVCPICLKKYADLSSKLQSSPSKITLKTLKSNKRSI